MSPNRREFLQALAAGVGVTSAMTFVPGAYGGPWRMWSSRSHPDPSGRFEWLSHRPMRPLPVASSRPIDEGSPAFFLSPSGRDSNDGRSEGRSWATLGRAAEELRPGDTLYVAGGHYWLDSRHVFNRSGSRENPVTIRTLPDQLAILDCGYREFFESPESAWEPCPASQGGVEGEYWSTRKYPLSRETRIVAGNFGDSMIPLFRYASMFDLRSQSELLRPELANNNYRDPIGIYCGPGAMWNPDTGRIHIRLSHTHIPDLARVDYLNHGSGFDHNYTGETDPRELPLVLHRNIEIGFRCSHVRVRDLIFQGQKRVEFGVRASHDIGLDVEGVHVYAGPQPFGAVVGGSGRLFGCRFRGYDAPWSNRFSDKNRTSHGQLVHLAGAALEVGHCEFTDHHDGVVMTDGNLTVEFHHNLIENMNDDGLYLNPRHPTRMVRIWQNILAGAVSYLPFAGGGQGVLSPEEVGCYIYRNLFDLRRRTYGGPPRASGGGAGFRSGLLTNEHSNSVRPNLFFYHNDILLADGANQDWLLARMGDDYMEAAFRVYNNILVQVVGRPRQNVRPIPSGTFDSRKNLLWGMRDGVAKTRPSEIYGDPRFVQLTADWRDGADLHLRAGSPAIDAGFEIPPEWPDPLRSLDAGSPDVGAVPFGVSGNVFGPEADL